MRSALWSVRILALSSFVLGPAALAQDEPSVDSAAKVQFEVDKAKADVAKKYGDKPVNELTREERLERAQQENDAANAVLEKHGTDAKSFNYQRGKMGRAENEEFNGKVKDLQKKDEEARAKKAQPPPVVVEKGLPVEDGFEVNGNSDVKMEQAQPQPQPQKGGKRKHKKE